MMRFIIIIFTQLLVYVNCAQKDNTFFPNLPVGDYIVGYKSIMACEKPNDFLIEHNLYLSKKSSNVTVVKGNITFKVAYDDIIKFNARMAIKDSVGSWKDNAAAYSATTGCSTFKFFLGAYWDEFTDSFNFPSKKCPLPAGVYASNDGFELPAVLSKSNFPKKFFYGTYKFRIYYHDKSKKEIGCIILVIELKRPWEL